MKKFAFILISLFCSFQMYSQLQSQFFECVLGKTSEKTVFNKLRQQKYNPSYYDQILFVNNIKFGSATWPCAAFYFQNDKLSEVRFMLDNTTTTRQSIRNTYISLRSMLLEKYRKNLLNQKPESISFGDREVIIVLTIEEDDIPNVLLRYLYAPFIIHDRDNGMGEL